MLQHTHTYSINIKLYEFKIIEIKIKLIKTDLYVAQTIIISFNKSMLHFLQTGITHEIVTYIFWKEKQKCSSGETQEKKTLQYQEIVVQRLSNIISTLRYNEIGSGRREFKKMIQNNSTI